MAWYRCWSRSRPVHCRAVGHQCMARGRRRGRTPVADCVRIRCDLHVVALGPVHGTEPRRHDRVGAMAVDRVAVHPDISSPGFVDRILGRPGLDATRLANASRPSCVSPLTIGARCEVRRRQPRWRVMFANDFGIALPSSTGGSDCRLGASPGITARRVEAYTEYGRQAMDRTHRIDDDDVSIGGLP